MKLSGELDMDSAPQVEEAVRQSLLAHARIVILDATALTFCDCAGLGSLLRGRQRVADTHATFHLENPSPILLRLAALSGTSGVLGLPVPPFAVQAGPARTEGAVIGVSR